MSKKWQPPASARSDYLTNEDIQETVDLEHKHRELKFGCSHCGEVIEGDPVAVSLFPLSRADDESPPFQQFFMHPECMLAALPHVKRELFREELLDMLPEE